MSDIKVIEIPTDKPLTSAERSDLFNKWSRETKTPINVFHALEKLIDAIDALDAKLSSPEMLMLKIRQICSFTTITPVVGEAKNRYKTIQDIKKEFNIPERKFGGRQPAKSSKPSKPSKPPNTPKTPNSTKTPNKPSASDLSDLYKAKTTFLKSQKFIHLNDLTKYTGDPGNFPKTLNVLNQNDRLSYIEFNTSLEVCGFIINPDLPVLALDPISFGYPVALELSDIIKRISDAEYLMTNVFLTGIQKIWDLNGYKGNPVFEKLADNHRIILFKDIEQATRVCDIIHQQLKFLIEQIRSDWAVWYTEWLNHNSRINPDYEWYEMFKPVNSMLVKDRKIKAVKITDVILEKLNGLYPAAFEFGSETALWFDMLNSGILNEWKHMQGLSGSDLTKHLNTVIKNRKEFLNAAIELRKRCQTDFANKYKEMSYRFYYIKIFGFDRFQNVIQKIPDGVLDGAEILNYISKSEAGIVKTELSKNEKFLEAQNNSKEPWIDMVRRLYSEESLRERKFIYNALKKMVKIPPGPDPRNLSKDPGLKNNDWIRSSKDYPIICPHARDMFELEFYKSVSANEIKKYIISNYAGDTPVYQAFYCRICGERLASTTGMEGVTSSMLMEGYSGVEDELRVYLWKAISQIVGMHIEFKEMKSNDEIKNFITDMSKSLYVFADLIDKKLRKEKTTSDEEREGRKRLLITIYIYALLIKIVVDNPFVVRFINPRMRGFRKIPPKKLFSYIVNVISTSQNTVINTISATGRTVTDAYIEQILDSAYKHISTIIGKSRIKQSVRPSAIINLLLDPLYNTLSDAWRIAHVGKYNNTREFMKIEMQSALPKQVLRTDLKEIQDKHRSLYERAGNPLKDYSRGWKSEDLKKAVANSSGNISKDLMKLWTSHTAAIVDFLLDYTQSEVYLKPVWKTTITKDPESGIDIITAEQGIDYKNFAKKYAAMKQLEYVKNNIYQHHRAHSIGELWIPKRNYRYKGFDIKHDFEMLAIVYGQKEHAANAALLDISAVSKFHKHKWETHAWVKVSKFDNKPLAKYKKKDITTSIPTESDWIMIDVFCSKCAAAFQDMQKGSAQIYDELNNNRLIVNFYNYYASLCPTPNAQDVRDGNPYHIFHKDQCKNCGFKTEYVDNLNMTFFNKFKSKFLVPKKTSIGRTAISIDQAKQVSKKTTWTDIKNWKYQNKIINEFTLGTFDLIRSGSKMENSPFSGDKYTKNEYFNIVSNLGLSQNVEHSVLKAKIQTEIGLKRRNIIHPYIQNILKDFGSILNHKNVAMPAPKIKRITDQISPKDIDKITSIKLSELSAKTCKHLGVQTDSYYKLSQALMLQSTDHEVVSKFTLSYLLALLLEIKKLLTSKQVSTAILNEIMLLLITQVLITEKNSTKLPPKKRVAVESQGDFKEDPNMVDNRQERTFDDIVDPDATDKFSYNDLDYDGSNDDF